MKAILRVASLWIVVFIFFAVSAAWADLTVGNYTLVNSKRVSRVEYEYTYKADVINTDNKAHNVSAQVVSSSPYTVVVESMLNFGSVSAGSTTQSTDTFTIRHNRRYPLNWDTLTWKVQFIDLTENAIIVDQIINTALQLADDNVLIFDRSVNFDIGTVLVFAPTELMPQGGLRKVTGINDTGTAIVVSTVQASLIEAIDNCHIDITHEIDPNNIEFSQIADGIIFTHNSPFDFITENFDFHDSIGIDAHLNITVGYDIEVDIVGASISFFRFTANVTEIADLSLQVNAPINADYEKELGKIDMFHHTIWVGWFPIVIDSNLYTAIGVSGTASAQMQQEIDQQATYEAGVEYRNGNWNIISDFDNDISDFDNDSNVIAELEAYIKATVDLRLYGVAGPFAISKIYSDLNADCENDPFLLWNYGLSVQPGVSVKISGETIEDILGINVPWGINLIPDIEYAYAWDPIVLFELELFSIEDSPICDIINPPPATLLNEDFESYSLNTWPSPWVPDANVNSNPANNMIIQDPENPSNQVLKMYGAVGGCWAALTYHPIVMPDDFCIEFKVYNGSETLSGCHPARASISLRQGTYWANPSFPLMLFKDNNTVGKSWSDILANYQPNQWYDIKIHYQSSGDQVTLTYWIDGSYIDQVAEQVDLNIHQSLDHFGLTVQEGSVYFDDIKIYISENLAAEAFETANMQPQGRRSQSAIAHHSVLGGSGL